MAGTTLKPCPFCQQPLHMRGGVNPYGRCQTEDCWLAERRIAVPLGDAVQVRQFNVRGDHSLLQEAADHIDGVTGARDRPGSDSGELVARIDLYLKGEA